MRGKEGSLTDRLRIGLWGGGEALDYVVRYHQFNQHGMGVCLQGVGRGKKN